MVYVSFEKYLQEALKNKDLQKENKKLQKQIEKLKQQLTTSKS